LPIIFLMSKNTLSQLSLSEKSMQNGPLEPKLRLFECKSITQSSPMLGAIICEHKCYFRPFLTKWGKGDVKSAGLTMEISRKTRKSAVCREIPLKSKHVIWEHKCYFRPFLTKWGKGDVKSAGCQWKFHEKQGKVPFAGRFL
jgi:hypothetical protein